MEEIRHRNQYIIHSIIASMHTEYPFLGISLSVVCSIGFAKFSHNSSSINVIADLMHLGKSPLTRVFEYIV